MDQTLHLWTIPTGLCDTLGHSYIGLVNHLMVS
jgi:hypothetical protein